jgi:hypothetical protein
MARMAGMKYTAYLRGRVLDVIDELCCEDYRDVLGEDDSTAAADKLLGEAGYFRTSKWWYVAPIGGMVCELSRND